MVTCDFLIIGGGIIGISIARELKKRYPNASQILIEKEADFGLHASGRNSGVLHAGFYYTADSFKAKFTQKGNQRLTEYCASKNIPVNRCGKLVVAKNEAELSQLDELMARAQANGVSMDSITEKEAKNIEPRVKTFERALFSPTTASVNPSEVVQAMREDSLNEGIEMKSQVRYMKKLDNNIIKTSQGNIEFGYMINTAGLYADKIALDFGFSKDYRILPFKGLYLYSKEPAGSFQTNIYPVPDLRNPFLGVHFTVTAGKKAKIGPTAIPAFWREQYKGLSKFNFDELLEILFRQAGLFWSSDFDFKTLAFEELQKYSREKMVSLASSLAEGVELKNFQKWGEPGIRAQLLNIRKRKLEMDFVTEGDNKSLHILNAVSPAFTCALPFADFACDKIAELSRS
ncbi:MAG: L-2-hydroxyglutarate oxidase [Nitrospinae bacterium]|nr:L-2-hydroxyglutarate oxidase [Nitrospinota bacterium]MZH05873.1 L-2-hydroxyglutarate oxidase [Nitrospinota bacterium]MZH15505.1 L-2-hydroxyglutarate oxidase [Nitrospinota bacterium]